MNKKLIYGGFVSLVTATMLSSCSGDYLSTEPITNISESQASSTTQAAQMSVYGIARIMYSQLSTSYPRACNGEATYTQYVNEVLGPDNSSYFNMGECGRNWYTWVSVTDKNNTRNNAIWDYCYMIISRANSILSTVGTAEGSESEKKWIEAQCRTYRAHGYIHALQWFAPRWQDSNNGEAYAVILRTEPGTGEAPLGTMNQILDLIYDDLNTAITLYGESGGNRTEIWQPDIEIAYGLLARAAMIKNDWATAKSAAHSARQGYSVASNADYMSGFIFETDDCMWSNWDNDIYWSTYGAWFSCNGSYPSNWGRGFAINIDLYRQLDVNDIRRQCFFTPDKAAEVAKIPGYESVASFTEADFWNQNNTTTGTVDCVAGGLSKLAEGFVKYACNNNPVSNQVTSLPYTMVGGAAPTSMQLGAQVKMWSIGQGGTYCDSKYPWMRATEMILTEAEAAYMSGDVKTAKECLTEINSLRIPGYVAPDGEALLDDIRLCRRIELWGEGHNWTDFKRWNIAAEERAFEAGVVTSGNTPATYASRHEPSAANGWRLAIPQSESDFNPAFDRKLLNYKE